MSVRTIPKNYQNLTGLMNSTKADGAFFESTLERDFLTIIEFDTNVQSYDVQPVSIFWIDEKGKRRTYTPDVLVEFQAGKCSFSRFDVILCEVKYRSELQRKWADFKPKFKAAIKYAKLKGWRFKLVTEDEIRTPFMENARFLLPYLSESLDESHEALLLEQLISLRECSVDALIKSIFNDKWAQAELIHSLWWLIASRRVSTDLNKPLTMSSRIWIGG
ncbi:TnsA endonuclease N-terminal domain-containing protein [Idiomarina sp.]|uniref:TnsA endonuclease N-terminal domain-containing protein n=1 Tax=Idiomarina sp. TaxID=1874361 RepID=UPI002631F33D|nr:TnsA endonuclease N-terminal domain-containing protein [Idiomarina sp.]